jgi:formiminotetrahydrofolate cyclodeaminase
MIDQKVTEKTLHQFVTEVSEQHHAMAGAVIAAGAAQAAALGQACIQISLELQPDQLDWRAVTAHIEQLAHIKETLLAWCDQDATAIAKYVALRDSGDELGGQELLCEAPAEMSRLSIEAAELLQDFRPQVVEQVQDDLEMAISLLAGTGQAAMLLLDSNLRIWPDQPALHQKYEPIRANLEAGLAQLSPLPRIRKA